MPPVEQVLAENQALKGTVETLHEKVVNLETQVAWLKKRFRQSRVPILIGESRMSLLFILYLQGCIHLYAKIKVQCLILRGGVFHRTRWSHHWDPETATRAPQDLAGHRWGA